MSSEASPGSRGGNSSITVNNTGDGTTDIRQNRTKAGKVVYTGVGGEQDVAAAVGKAFDMKGEMHDRNR